MFSSIFINSSGGVGMTVELVFEDGVMDFSLVQCNSNIRLHFNIVMGRKEGEGRF